MYMYYPTYFGKILYRLILKITAEFSIKLSAFIWNMIFSGWMKYLDTVTHLKGDTIDGNVKILLITF